MVRQPMKPPSKSLTDAQVYLLKYPVFGSWKIDGHLCLTENRAYSSNLQPIRNRHIQKILSSPEYNGAQGELCYGSPFDRDCFNRTSRLVSNANKVGTFDFYIFDTFYEPYRNYGYRLEQLKKRYKDLPYVIVLEQKLLNTPKEVFSFLDECIAKGLEGIVVRSPYAHYKEGRGTWAGQEIFKIKQYEDDEAEIVGFIEQMGNLNVAYKDARGLSKRSSSSEGKFPKGTLGTLLLKSFNKSLPWYGRVFPCARGNMTEQLAHYIWNHRHLFLGKLVTYRYEVSGIKDLPRSARWKGFREKSDMTEF